MTEQKTVARKPRSIAGKPCLYTLHIELRPNEIRPPVWRRLEIDGRISLAKLHHVIQAAFGWSDSHLHAFEINGMFYGQADADAGESSLRDERKAFVNRLVLAGDRFTYRYNFDDNWEHVITVENAVDVEDDPSGAAWILEGARACPPDDVGGPEGYYEFLDILTNKPKSDEAERLRRWIDGDFDPERFDRRMANASIARLLINRWAGK